MRKGHGSTKVPGVKLRPAQTKSSKPKPAAPSVFTTVEDDDVVRPGSSDRPFAEVLLAASGISDKNNLFRQAQALGAETTQHLMDTTTHLVVNEPGSVKFRVALDRKIPLMTEKWITECHLRWLAGEDVDFKESVNRYRLPIFKDVIASLTWYSDLDVRHKIVRKIEQQEGGHLNKITDERVTHLICGGDGDGEPSDKIIYARGHNEDVQKGRKEGSEIRIVWEEWYYDSLEFGGRFPEEEYSITRPKPRRKTFVPPVKKSQTRGALLASNSSLNSAPAATLDLNMPSAPSDHVTVADSRFKRVGSKRVLEDIIKTRADWKVEDGRIGKKGEQRETVRDDENRAPSPLPPAAEKESEIISAPKPGLQKFTQRTSSFNASKPKNGRKPLDSILNEVPDAFEADDGLGGLQEPLESTTFKSKYFSLFGETGRDRVVNSIKRHGGSLLVSKSEPSLLKADFILVRLASGGPIYENFSGDLRRKVRTECWLERCFASKSIWELDQHPCFRPITIPTPMDFKDLGRHVVFYSGLEIDELMWTKRVLAALGIEVPKTFSERCTHLICPSRKGPKYEKALEWDKMIVDLDWLWNLAGLFDTVKPATGVDLSCAEGLNNTAVNDFIAQPSTSKLSPSPKRSPKRCLPDTEASEGETLSFGQPTLLTTTNTKSKGSPLKRARTVVEATSSSSPWTSPGSKLFWTANRTVSMSAIGETRHAEVVPSSSPLTSLDSSTNVQDNFCGPSTQTSNGLRNMISELLVGSTAKGKGKERADSKDVEELPSVESAEHSNRQSKRPRPTRIKSKTDIVPQVSSKPPSAAREIPLPDSQDDEQAEETSQGDQSLAAITYKDVGQEKEQKRLMKLLSGSSQPDKSLLTGTKRKRRNAGRVGGF